MNQNHITVVYRWTANPGKLDELKSIYEEVSAQMERTEEGAEEVYCYLDEENNELHVRDEFRDAAALGFHLSQTAAAHFPKLLAIAKPGPFFFLGEVPQEMVAATQQMQLDARFAPVAFGFSR